MVILFRSLGCRRTTKRNLSNYWLIALYLGFIVCIKSYLLDHLFTFRLLGLHFIHRISTAWLQFNQLCLEFLCKNGVWRRKEDCFSFPSENKTIPQLWAFELQTETLSFSWKPELQQPELLTDRVCDLSGVLWRVSFPGLLNKGHILGTRPSVAWTKEEPKTLIYCQTLFLFCFL